MSRVIELWLESIWTLIVTTTLAALARQDYEPDAILDMLVVRATPL